MPDRLPLYSPTSHCPKCGCVEADHTEYCRIMGVIVRICALCGASRNERPLDQATEKELASRNEGNA